VKCHGCRLAAVCRAEIVVERPVVLRAEGFRASGCILLMQERVAFVARVGYLLLHLWSLQGTP